MMSLIQPHCGFSMVWLIWETKVCTMDASQKLNCIITRITVILSVVRISVLDTVPYTTGKYRNFSLTTLLAANMQPWCGPDVVFWATHLHREGEQCNPSCSASKEGKASSTLQVSCIFSCIRRTPLRLAAFKEAVSWSLILWVHFFSVLMPTKAKNVPLSTQCPRL